MLVESVQNVRWMTIFGARQFSTLSQRKRVGMSHVATRCAHDVVPWYSEHTGCRSELYPRTSPPPPPSDFAIECEVRLAFFIHVARPSTYSSCSTESSVQDLLGTESNIPTTSRHNVGFSVLYRPSTPWHVFRHEFGTEALGAHICRIVTPWHVRKVHHLSCLQAPHKQEMAIHVSEPPQASAWFHTERLRWHRCARPCSTSVPCA